MTHDEETIKIGGRGSKLSRWQLSEAQKALEKAWPHHHFAIEIRQTAGDQNTESPLPEIGGKGIFTAELEHALIAGEIDLAVHSQKDLPIQNPKGLCIGALLKRGHAADALVSAQGYTLETLPKGATLGTSSTRRKAQLLNIRPDLNIVNLRGNVDTRLRKSLEFDGIILAYAGLFRLGLANRVSQILPLETFLPAPAQGSIAIQCRQDPKLLELLKPIHDISTELCTLAERAFLEGLGGGCSLPISALASLEGDQIKLRVQVLKPDGSAKIEKELSGKNPRDLGLSLAQICISEGANEYISG
ncbi:MAG: hydroxymethylbilane synthase [Myxococcaceae bacterium]